MPQCDDFYRTIQLPEEQHGDEEEDGAPRAVMEDAAVNADTPDDRQDERTDEEGEALVRFVRCEAGEPCDFCVIAFVCHTECAQEIRRDGLAGHRRRGGGQVACGRQFSGQRVGECDGFSREDALRKGECSALRLDNAQPCTAANQTVCIMGEEYIDVAFICLF